MPGAFRFWANVAGGAALSGTIFMVYMFFSAGICRAALEFAPACTLESRWQALWVNREGALFLLPIALCIGALVGMRVARLEKKARGK